MNSPTPDLGRDAGDRSYHVTAVITHRVKEGQTQLYEQWIEGISAAARSFEGHIGVNILRPPANAQPDYVIVLQFDACARLNVWLNSETRKAWIERVKPLIKDRETIQVLTGLEAWFQLPTTQARRSAPKRYKQAILVWIAVMIVSLAVSPLVDPLLASLPWPLGLAANVALTVFFLSYVLMPLLTRWFRRWLFAD
ncbi:MAG: antibiotic biosynthesis monooxygenase [Cyanobacteria bacterium J06639_1]